MRRIRMLKLSAGPAGVRQPGSEHDLDDAAAAELVAAEGAEYVEVAAEREEPTEDATTADDTERAVSRSRRGRRGKEDG